MPFMVSARQSCRLIGCIAAALLFVPAAFGAGETAPGKAGPSAASDAEAFCANIGDAASDARAAWEARTLNALRADLEAKIEALDAKRAELEDWVGRREAFQNLAEESIVAIYARMQPDAAAEQLSLLDPSTAAAVLTKLKARVASAILGEMDAPRAVSLATLISTGGEMDDPGAVRQ